MRFVKHGIAILGLMPGIERQSWALRIATLGDILVVRGYIGLRTTIMGLMSRIVCHPVLYIVQRIAILGLISA